MKQNTAFANVSTHKLHRFKRLPYPSTYPSYLFLSARQRLSRAATSTKRNTAIVDRLPGNVCQHALPLFVQSARACLIQLARIAVCWTCLFSSCPYHVKQFYHASAYVAENAWPTLHWICDVYTTTGHNITTWGFIVSWRKESRLFALISNSCLANVRSFTPNMRLPYPNLLKRN